MNSKIGSGLFRDHILGNIEMPKPSTKSSSPVTATIENVEIPKEKRPSMPANTTEKERERLEACIGQ